MPTSKRQVDQLISGLNTSINKLQSTGVISGTGASINLGDNTKFDFQIVGQIVDPVTFVIYSININLTAQTVTNIAIQDYTYLGVNNAGLVIQQSTPFTSAQRYSLITEWQLVHYNRTNIESINSYPNYPRSMAEQLHSFMDALGMFNVEGNVFSANGNNTNIDKTLGIVQKLGVGNTITSPNDKIFPSAIAATFDIINQSGTQVNGVTNVDTTNYDLAGTTTTLPGSPVDEYFQTYRIYLYGDSKIKLQRGQFVYGSIAEAMSAINTENYIVEPGLKENGILRAYLIVKKGTTDLSDTTKAKFIEADRFGMAPLYGLVSTLQNAYDASVIPSITPNDIKGAFQVKNGRASNASNIQEWKNIAGTITSYIQGDGTFYTNSNLYAGIDGTSKIGFGTVSPSAKFHIKDASVLNAVYQIIESEHFTANLVLNSFTNGASTSGGSTIHFQENSVDKLNISVNSANSTSLIESKNGNNLTLANSQAGGMIMNFYCTGPATHLGITSNTTDLMWLSQTGNLGIGASFNPYALPTARLQVKGIDATSGNYGLKVDNTIANIFAVRNDGATLFNNSAFINNISAFQSLLAGDTLGTLNNNLNIVAGIGTPGSNILRISYYGNTQWLSALSIQNADASYGNLVLMQAGGFVSIGATTISAAKLEITGGAYQGIYVTSSGQIGVNAVDTTGYANKAETDTGTAYRANITNVAGIALDLYNTTTTTQLFKVLGNGKIYALPTYADTTNSGTNRLLGIDNTGKLYNTGIDPASIGGGSTTLGLKEIGYGDSTTGIITSSSVFTFDQATSEFIIDGFSIRKLGSYTIFKPSGSNGYLFNNAADNANLLRITNTGQLLAGLIADTDAVGASIIGLSTTLTSNSTKEFVALFQKNNTERSGVSFSSKLANSYINPFTASNGQVANLILGGYDGAGTILETLTLGYNNNVGIGTTAAPTAKLHILQNTVSTGAKGISVNFNTIGEVFSIDDNALINFYSNNGVNITGGNGILNLISNGGSNPYVIFKYNNGANTSGSLSGDNNNMFLTVTDNFGIGSVYYAATSKLQVKGINSLSSHYAFKVDNTTNNIFSVRNDGVSIFTSAFDAGSGNPNYQYSTSIGSLGIDYESVSGSAIKFLQSTVVQGFIANTSGYTNIVSLNRIAFKSYTSGKNHLWMDASSGFIGIGDDYFASSASLHVQGISSTSSDYSLKVDNTTTTILSVRNDGNVYAGNNTVINTLNDGGYVSNTSLGIVNNRTNAVSIYNGTYVPIFNIDSAGSIVSAPTQADTTPGAASTIVGINEVGKIYNTGINPSAVNTGTFGITIDGGGSVITTGFKQYLIIPYNCIITGWSVIGDVSGSIVVDVWKDTTIPTVLDTIAGSEKPTLSSQQTNSDNTLTTWTTTVNAGDIIGFNVDSVNTITKATVIIKITKT